MNQDLDVMVDVKHLHEPGEKQTVQKRNPSVENIQMMKYLVRIIIYA
jgi:hypothetical protein